MNLKIIVIFFALLMFMSGCSKDKSSAHKQTYDNNELYALDTIITINIADPNISQEEKGRLLKECFQLVKNYEQKLSKTIKNSEVSKINDSKGNETNISEETYFLIEKSLEYNKLSRGAFDITVEPIVALWDVNNPNPKVPTDEKIKNALKKVGSQNINLKNGNTIVMKNSSKIDLGAIAKGYIADKTKQYLVEKGCKSAILNFGGNIVTIGSKDNGVPWKVGIENPNKTGSNILATLKTVDESVVTSGTYERYFEKDGKIYHHILDPSTGYPADNEISSVTIISDISADGDALSTSCLVLGKDKALELLESLPDIEGIIVTKDGQIIPTSSVGDRLSIGK